ncbi:MAG: hypothetical protein AB7O96_10350 [Pseudobdellovibrionaceae bacterium]
MKKLVFLTVLLSSFAAFAGHHGGGRNYTCKTRTAAWLENHYNVDIVRTRVLGGWTGYEVWAKDSDGQTYSVFFTDSSCQAYKRHIVW